MSEKLSRSKADPTVSVAVVYDSGSRGYPALSGRTRVLAEAIARGAGAVEGTAVTLIPVADRASHWERGWTRPTLSSSAAQPTWVRARRR